MAQAEHGDTVRVNYMGKLEDGTVFGSNINSEPLQFKIGEGQVIPGLEDAVKGMKPGESKTVKIPAEKAHGPHRKEGVFVLEREVLPAHLDLEVGRQLRIPRSDDQTAVVTIADVSESRVTLDANHPLAGKDLIFDIKLLEIV